MASIDKRPNGTYRARWREYASGPQKTKTFTRKTDAQRFLVEIEHRLQSGSYVDPKEGQTTLSAFAAQWVKLQPWRASTGVTAQQALDHILPKLGDRPLAGIRRSDVQAFVTGLGLGALTVRKVVWRTLSAMLDAAVEDGLIVRNVARGVKLPAVTGGEIVPPTVEQVAEIHDAAAEWFRPAVDLGAGLGLRQGETTGFTADRILWLKRAVRVDRQWLSRQKPPDFGPPKSRSSDRTIPASAFVLDRLAAHVGRRHDGFVVHRDGEPVDHRIFNNEWRRARAVVGLDHIRYHDLRHAFASALISQGCSVKAVASALGHSTAATTLNMYAHLWPGDEDRIRQAIDNTMQRAAEDSLRTGTTHA